MPPDVEADDVGEDIIRKKCWTVWIDMHMREILDDADIVYTNAHWIGAHWQNKSIGQLAILKSWDVKGLHLNFCDLCKV